MRSFNFALSVGYLLFFLGYAHAYDLGAWYKRAPEIPHSLNTRFEPSFLILKAGIFNNSGNLKTIGETSDLKKLCEQHLKLVGWFTHRLKKNDKLNPEAGETLAKQILKNYGSTCIEAIELDIEPLTGDEAWIKDFVSKLKETLSGKLKVRWALPLLSESKISGPSWSKENAKKLLKQIDGIDLMLYDSGIKTKEDYTVLLKYNLDTARELLKEQPEKSVLLGIPAYHERTRLHVDNVENVATFVAFLKTLSLEQASKICTGHIRLSLYAGWTLSPEDRNSITDFKQWADEICKKDK